MTPRQPIVITRTQEAHARAVEEFEQWHDSPDTWTPWEAAAYAAQIAARETQILAEPEPTMTVRVVDRSRWGTSGPYPWVRTVTVSAYCPACGARRGEPYAHRFAEDGAWYTCDRWTNPCGHVDMYAAVIVEAGRRHQDVTDPESLGGGA